MIKRFCVFCGNRPSQKTREHIIPKWLIEFTGDPNRPVYLGRDWLSPNLDKRIYSWSAFTFPACKNCNNYYSHLETQAQKIIFQLLEGGAIAASELDNLMDWFDKIRVGIWLGMLYLNNNYRGIIPQFHIGDRIRQKDRMIVIFESDERDQGIGLSGCDTPLFHKMPSVCEVVINHLHFVTVSSDFLLARQFGWPYASTKRAVDINTDGFHARISLGTNQIQPPIIDDFPNINGRFIFQPIAHQDVIAHNPEIIDKFYTNDFVRKTSCDPQNCIGMIFINNLAPIPYPNKPINMWMPTNSYPKRLLMQNISLWVATMQRKLFLNLPDFSHFPKEDQEVRLAEINGAIALQDRIIEHITHGSG